MDFWGLIFQDHLFFIYDALDKDETAMIEYVRSLYNNYTGSRRDMETILDLKKELLRLSLAKEIDIKLDPTFLNHMINEGEAALNKPVNTLLLHKLWLLDAEGHEITIVKMLDPVEKELTKELKKGCKTFNKLFCKTLEFIGYLRANPKGYFPAMDSLNDSAKANINIYLELVTTIYEGVVHGETLGTIKPIMLDHMLREQSYYLEQIGGTSDFMVDYTVRGIGIPERL